MVLLKQQYLLVIMSINMFTFAMEKKDTSKKTKDALRVAYKKKLSDQEQEHKNRRYFHRYSSSEEEDNVSYFSRFDKQPNKKSKL
jgi:hypothetical protein